MEAHNEEIKNLIDKVEELRQKLEQEKVVDRNKAEQVEEVGVLEVPEVDIAPPDEGPRETAKKQKTVIEITSGSEKVRIEI